MAGLLVYIGNRIQRESVLGNGVDAIQQIVYARTARLFHEEITDFVVTVGRRSITALIFRLCLDLIQHVVLFDDVLVHFRVVRERTHIDLGEGTDTRILFALSHLHDQIVLMGLHELEVGQQKFGVLFRSTVHREIQSVSAFFDVLRNVIRIQSKRMDYEFRVVLKHLRNGVDKQFEPQCFVVFRRSNRANTNGISILQVQNRSTKDQHVPIEPVQLHMQPDNVAFVDVIADVADDRIFGSIELQ